MVIVKDDRQPPNKWLLGRVVDLHPGQDDLIRVATIRTKNGIYKRSISKLCRLPIPNQLDNNNSNNNNEISSIIDSSKVNSSSSTHHVDSI